MSSLNVVIYIGGTGESIELLKKSRYGIIHKIKDALNDLRSKDFLFIGVDGAGINPIGKSRLYDSIFPSISSRLKVLSHLLSNSPDIVPGLENPMQMWLGEYHRLTKTSLTLQGILYSSGLHILKRKLAYSYNSYNKKTFFLCGVSRGGVSCYLLAKLLETSIINCLIHIVGVESVPGNITDYPMSLCSKSMDLSSLTKLRSCITVLGGCIPDGYLKNLFFEQLNPVLNTGTLGFGIYFPMEKHCDTMFHPPYYGETLILIRLWALGIISPAVDALIEFNWLKTCYVGWKKGSCILKQANVFGEGLKFDYFKKKCGSRVTPAFDFIRIVTAIEKNNYTICEENALQLAECLEGEIQPGRHLKMLMRLREINSTCTNDTRRFSTGNLAQLYSAKSKGYSKNCSDRLPSFSFSDSSSGDAVPLKYGNILPTLNNTKFNFSDSDLSVESYSDDSLFNVKNKRRNSVGNVISDRQNPDDLFLERQRANSCDIANKLRQEDLSFIREQQRRTQDSDSYISNPSCSNDSLFEMENKKRK